MKNKAFNTSNDLLALRLLEKYIPKNSYLPYTSSSLSFEAIRIIANDIVLNKRHRIIEFGSGISTLILGSIVNSIDQEITLTTIDENEDWVKILNGLLKKEGINNVNVVHSEINENSTGKDKHWYTQHSLRKNLLHQADLVVVDGPSAWKEGKEMARQYALDFLLQNDLLDKSNFAIYLDDCNRKSESNIIRNWSSTLSLPYREMTNSLARISHNDTFNII